MRPGVAAGPPRSPVGRDATQGRWGGGESIIARRRSRRRYRRTAGPQRNTPLTTKPTIVGIAPASTKGSRGARRTSPKARRSSRALAGASSPALRFRPSDRRTRVIVQDADRDSRLDGDSREGRRRAGERRLPEAQPAQLGERREHIDGLDRVRVEVERSKPSRGREGPDILDSVVRQSKDTERGVTGQRPEVVDVAFGGDEADQLRTIAERRQATKFTLVPLERTKRGGQDQRLGTAHAR